MAPSLDDAFDKLRWARHHFEVLRSEIEPFEQRDTHRFTFEVDADAGEYVFHVHGLEPPHADWGLRIGDCLHNARTALDYLMVQLVALATGDEPRDVRTISFPVETERAKFARRVERLREDHPALSGYLTRIEELQPFNVGNVSIWGTGGHGWPLIHVLPPALQRLSALDIIDKHRVVHAAWLGHAWHRAPSISSFAPEGFTPGAGSMGMGPLEDGAEIGRWRFHIPLPEKWEPEQMDMKRAFPLEVAFDEPHPSKGVLEILPFCLWGVESVLRLFEPVFTRHAPPLPVTAIPNLR